MAWERYQDELERIKGENTYDDLHDFEDKSLSLRQETSFLWPLAGPGSAMKYHR